MGNLVMYLLLLFVFIPGSIYNFRIWKQCMYQEKLTKPRSILLIMIPLIFCIIAYIGGNEWYNYILAISASTLFMSRIIGVGIHEKGIYYYHGRRMIPYLAKWEEIKDIKIDTSKNKLQSFKFKTKTIFPDQYYSTEDIIEIEKYIDR